MLEHDDVCLLSGFIGGRVAWARIDDGLTFHPKVLAAGNAAVGVWVRLLAWSAQHLTDGSIPRPIGIQIDRRSVQIRRLIVSGMLEVNGDDLQIHDYLEYNPSRAQVLADREKSRQRKQKSRGVSRRDDHRDAGRTDGGTPTPPSHPIPSHPLDREIGTGRTFSKLHEVEAAGYEKFKSITGTAIPAIRRLLDDAPITAEEIEAATTSKAYAWAGAAMVIAQCRADASQPPPQRRKQETPDERAKRAAEEVEDQIKKGEFDAFFS